MCFYATSATFETTSLESPLCLSCPLLQDADGQASLDTPLEEPKQEEPEPEEPKLEELELEEPKPEELELEEPKLEEPEPEVCEMPSQKQLAVESVEMSVESSLSGHVVPEVTIEG